jgi:hypothetical protein
VAVFRDAGFRDITVRNPDFSAVDALLAGAPMVRAYSSSFSLVAVNAVA